MLQPPNEQVEAGRIAKGAILLGKNLCKTEIDGEKLDREIEQFIRDHGGVPALKGYRPPFDSKSYAHTICLSLNTEAVHGTPVKLVTPEDLISIDLVVGYQGWFADTARTFTYSKDRTKQRFAAASSVIFHGALAAILPQRPMSLYGTTVEAAANHVGCTPVTEYCGHGIGQLIHLEPQVLNYKHNSSAIFQAGRSYAVEPVLAINLRYNLNKDHPDGWTVSTDCLSSHNEDTVFISDHGVINLTGDLS